MRMIIGINNKSISDRLINKYKDEYKILIIDDLDLIVESIYDNSEEILVIVRADLKGKITFTDFIYKIKETNPLIRVVVIIKELSQKMKEMLFSKEVFNIIEGNNFMFDELVQNIENPKMVIYKSKNNMLNKNNIILVTGVKNSGKTTFVNILSESFGKVKNKKVIALDLDFIYPTLDIYVNSNQNYSLAEYIKDVSNKEIKSMENYESINKKYNNVRYILNSKSIPIPDENIIIDMLNILSKYYDYVIVDTSTFMINKIYNIANKLNAHIVFIIEENIKSIRNFKIESNFIDSTMLPDTKLIINKYRGNKKILSAINKYINISLYGHIRESKYIENHKLNLYEWMLKIKLVKLKKSIGVIRFEKLKLKIIKKILHIEEE